jgi:predicted transcriptional regulator
MSSITVSIPDDHMNRLRELAAQLKITPEQLARIGIEDLLARPDDAFEQAAGRIIEKNRELYRRLA